MRGCSGKVDAAPTEQPRAGRTGFGEIGYWMRASGGAASDDVNTHALSDWTLDFGSGVQS